jgi:hypothetical protein
MRWPKITAVLLLFALAAVFAVANIWYTAVRSTIPLALDTIVLSKEVRREKHEGKDDVFLLELEGLGLIQVDREIYESTSVGETLRKERLSRELHHGDQLLTVHWSRDCLGMLTAMPLCLGSLAVLLIIALGSARPDGAFNTRSHVNGATRLTSPDITR